MALRDWLTLDLSPDCLKNNPKITGITTVTPEITTPVIQQPTENKGNSYQESQNHKNHNHNTSNLKKQGMHRLEIAGAGLPVTLKELADFFRDDLQSFGAGDVEQAGIRKACEWYAYQHKSRAQPKREEIPAGMVRCTDCLQDRCKHRQVTPWGDVIMQSSPQRRWCNDYTAKVHQITDYRRR